MTALAIPTDLEPTAEDMREAESELAGRERHERQTYLLAHLGQVAEFVAAGIASNDVIRHAVALHRAHQALWAEAAVAAFELARPEPVAVELPEQDIHSRAVGYDGSLDRPAVTRVLTRDGEAA